MGKTFVYTALVCGARTAGLRRRERASLSRLREAGTGRSRPTVRGTRSRRRLRSSAQLVELQQAVRTIFKHSPDSGTCGNDWAQDTFDRYFKVTPGPSGTFRVSSIENGTFTRRRLPASPATVRRPPAGQVATSIRRVPSHGHCDFGSRAERCTATRHGGHVHDIRRLPEHRDRAPPTTCGTTSGFLATVFPTGIADTRRTFPLRRLRRKHSPNRVRAR